MMPTFTAPMLNNNRNRQKHVMNSAFTLTEIVVVILMISLFVVFAQMNFFRLLSDSIFKSQARDLVATLQMAVNASAESNRRYEVIIDMVEQSFVLRETTLETQSQVLEEEIIIEKEFNDNCRIEYVLFDDGDYVEADRTGFWAGHYGWQYGGVIVLLDDDDRPYTVVVNRISRVVKLKQGEWLPLEPKFANEVPF